MGARLQKRSLALPDKQPYFLVRGLRPQRFSKRRNVIIFTGIASHVGTKRAVAKGDPTVLRTAANPGEYWQVHRVLIKLADHVTNIEVPEMDREFVYRGPGNRSVALVLVEPPRVSFVVQEEGKKDLLIAQY